MRYLLIDADIVAYKCASLSEDSIDWGDGETSKAVADIKDAQQKVINTVESYVDELKGEPIICLSDDDVNWRNTVLPSYKQHRKTSVRPELLYPLKAFLFENWRSYRKPTLEGDDVMGILSTHPKLLKGEKIIVSIDKDMQTIPGLLYNPDKDNEPQLISEAYADYFHMYQTVMGDATDGYKGCPGIGEVKAAKLLQSAIDAAEAGACDVNVCMWDAVVEAYELAGLTEEDALVQARVARICRHTEYNFKKREVKLWLP